MDQKVNISPDVVWDQINQEEAKKNRKASDSDDFMRNYFNPFLPSDMDSISYSIRILPFSLNEPQPFHKIVCHTLEVNPEMLRNKSESKYKTFNCVAHTKELQEKHGTKCAICDLYNKYDKLEREATNELEKNKYHDMKLKCTYREHYVARVIVRGKEAEGVKFWRFPLNKKGKGPYDQIMSQYKSNYQEAMSRNDTARSNIFDLYNGFDIIINISRDKEGKPVSNYSISRYESPVTNDEKQLLEWVNDKRVWTDYYGVKPYEYLLLAAQGEVPYFDKETQKYVSKKEYKEKMDKQEAETASYVNEKMEELSQHAQMPDDDNMDGLPF